jgi:hypothetical protein
MRVWNPRKSELSDEVRANDGIAEEEGKRGTVNVREERTWRREMLQ